MRKRGAAQQRQRKRGPRRRARCRVRMLVAVEYRHALKRGDGEEASEQNGETGSRSSPESRTASARRVCCSNGDVGERVRRRVRPRFRSWREASRRRPRLSRELRPWCRRGCRCRAVAAVLARHRDHGRAQQPVADRVAGLHHIHDRAGGLALARHFGDRLMQVGIELAVGCVDLLDAMIAPASAAIGGRWPPRLRSRP